VTNLRLMIDAEYWSLAPYLDKVSKKVKAQTSKDYGYPGNTPDSRLVQATKTDGSVLVTRDDNTIKRRMYPPCTHGGIIFIQAKNLGEPILQKVFRNLCQSKESNSIIGHLTYLYERHAIIFTHKEKITVRWYVSNKKRNYEYTKEPLKQGAPLLL
jgi:hypothetical protein